MPSPAPRSTSLLGSTSLLAGLAVIGAGALLLAGCSAATSTTTATSTTGGTSTTGPGTHPSSAAVAGTLTDGFADPSAPPAPEATFSPSPGSWDGAHPPRGYRVVLLSSGEVDADGDGEDGEAAAPRTLIDAVDRWADTEGVTVTRVQPRSSSEVLDTVLAAVAEEPDLVISVGNDMVDPVAAITPSALHQQFLVLGAEIAEPTSNVTAADWTGAGFRGEGLGAASHHDPTTFTAERAGRALRAGVAAVLHGFNGTVVWVA